MRRVCGCLLSGDSLVLRSEAAVSGKVLLSLLVEELSVLEVIVRIVTGNGIGYDLGVSVSEVDVSHVLLVMEHIGIVGVRVPEDVQVVLAFEMTLSHCNQGAGHTEEDVGPYDWTDQEEPRVDGSHQLVVRMH